MDKNAPFKSREIAVLLVSGMTCGGCASTVARVLSRVPGVADAKVDLDRSRATVTGEAPPEALIAAVEAAGYGVQFLDPNGSLGGSNDLR